MFMDRVRERWPVLLAVLAAVVIAGWFAINGLGGKNTIQGTLVLRGANGGDFYDYGDMCYGAHELNDIKSGTTVQISNESGDVIANAKLEDDPSGDPDCQFKFTAKVPNTDSYTVEIGSGERGGTTYTRSDLEQADWKVDLSLR